MITKRVLVIEDDKQIADIVMNKLKEVGFDTMYAEDGEKGLELAMDEKPDLVLLDLIIPKIDGITLLGRLRDSDKGKDIPVIVLTNVEGGLEIDECKKKGIYDYLVKTNWTLNEIVEKVQRALK